MVTSSNFLKRDTYKKDMIFVCFFFKGTSGFDKLVDLLQEMGHKASRNAVFIENLVAGTKLNFSILLPKLSSDPLHKRYCVSQKEKFPCVNYYIRTMQPNITVRIFANGTLLIQAAKNMTDVAKALQLMIPV